MAQRHLARCRELALADARIVPALLLTLGISPGIGSPVMLVLSRKQNQSIVFPRLGISVEITRIAGRTVSVGVKAPREIEILRGELLGENEVDSDRGHAVSTPNLVRSSADETKHELRNRLNKANLALKLVSKQLAIGRIEDAEISLSTALQTLNAIDQQTESTEPAGDFESSAGEDGQTRESQSQRKRALLVEDDPNERALLASYLRASGFDVDTAEDGHAALEYLANGKPDAVVMDMEMPRLGGNDTVRKIRSNDFFDDMRVFVVSGTEQKLTNLTTGARGVQRWFQKPLCPEDLVREMSTTLH